MGTFVGPEYDELLWGVLFRMVYGEWYCVCDFVVLSVMEYVLTMVV